MYVCAGGTITGLSELSQVALYDFIGVLQVVETIKIPTLLYMALMNRDKMNRDHNVCVCASVVVCVYFLLLDKGRSIYSFND